MPVFNIQIFGCSRHKLLFMSTCTKNTSEGCRKSAVHYAHNMYACMYVVHIVPPPVPHNIGHLTTFCPRTSLYYLLFDF